MRYSGLRGPEALRFLEVPGFRVLAKKDLAFGLAGLGLQGFTVWACLRFLEGDGHRQRAHELFNVQSPAFPIIWQLMPSPSSYCGTTAHSESRLRIPGPEVLNFEPEILDLSTAQIQLFREHADVKACPSRCKGLQAKA